MKIIAIVQARTGSSRLPNKVMKHINNTPMIGLLLSRLSNSKLINQLILATTDMEEDKFLSDYVTELGYDVFSGSEKDVLDRYYSVATKYKADVIVRVTGDCPLIDPRLVDKVIQSFLDRDVDYASNINPPTYPHGLDVEVFGYSTLEYTWKNAKLTREREHVTPFIRESNFFNKHNIESDIDFSWHRWTVDEPADFIVVNNIYNHFSPRINYSWEEITDCYENNKSLFSANEHLSLKSKRE